MSTEPKHFQYALSSISAKELAKEFNVEEELLPPLKISDPPRYISLTPKLQIVKMYGGKNKNDKRLVWGSNYHRYFLLAKDEAVVQEIIEKSCSGNDFCFRDINFKFKED